MTNALATKPIDGIEIPYNLTPFDDQMPVCIAIEQGIRRAAIVWHRRRGKDIICFGAIMVKEAIQHVGNYFYIFPEYSQARKAIWDGITEDGKKFLDFIPPELIKRKSSQSMFIELINGSTIQFIGSDNYNSIMGTNPRGIVFSEYSLQNPMAWEYIRPIVAKNPKAWVIFNFTPRGHNHAKDLWDMAVNDPAWFTQLLTVLDTGAVSMAAIEAERKMGMSEAMIKQEFYCSFEGGMYGAYYADQLTDARAENRIRQQIPLEPYPVDTYWDIGINDSTAIWFIQHIGNEVRVVGCYVNQDVGLQHYATYLQQYQTKRKFTYGRHYGPHDMAVRELGTGVSRLETLAGMGIEMELAPRMSLEDGINAVRTVLPLCFFDENECKGVPVDGIPYDGIKALSNYRKEWDEINRVFRNKPKHDWSSHPADAFRMLAVSYKELADERKMKEIRDKATIYSPEHAAYIPMADYQKERAHKQKMANIKSGSQGSDFDPFGGL